MLFNVSFGLRQVEAGTPEQCLARCAASAACASWTLDAAGACTLAKTVPFNRCPCPPGRLSALSVSHSISVL